MSLEVYEATELQRIASVLVGCPYKYGAEVSGFIPPERVAALALPFDCSELVEYMFFRIGYRIVDGSINQWRLCVKTRTPVTGVLAFKKRVGDAREVGHVGLVLNNDSIVEATPPAVRIVKPESFAKNTRTIAFVGYGIPMLQRMT